MKSTEDKGPNVAFCSRLSHLLYRIQNATNTRQRFLFATQLPNFESEFKDSEQWCLRILMALDPDFIALLLRSNVAPVIDFALQLCAKVIISKRTASHVLAVIPILAELQSRIMSSDLSKDEVMGNGLYDITPSRLIYDSLVLLKQFRKYQGKKRIFEFPLDVLELEESVDDLADEMFNLSISTRGNVNSICTDSSIFECVLCDKLRLGDFKDESQCISQLYKDLDTLLHAHLGDCEILTEQFHAHDEGAEQQNDLTSILYNLGIYIISQMQKCQVDLNENDVSHNQSSISIIMDLLPSERCKELSKQCLKSGNYDLSSALMEFVMQHQQRAVANDVFSFAIQLLDQHLDRKHVIRIFNFANSVLNLYGLGLIENDLVSFSTCLVRRAEIELHQALEEHCRGILKVDVSGVFGTLEYVFMALSNEHVEFNKDVGKIFDIVHGIIKLAFDFYDNVNDHSELLSSVTRLIGCWMTLEPTHFKSLYLRKLPLISRKCSTDDFAWLFPTFRFIDPCDLNGVGGLVAKTLEVIVNCNMSQDKAKFEKFVMACELLERLFMDTISDVAMLMDETVPNPSFSIKVPPKIPGEMFTGSYALPIEYSAQLQFEHDLDSIIGKRLAHVIITMGTTFQSFINDNYIKLSATLVNPQIDINEDIEVFNPMNVEIDDIDLFCNVTACAGAVCLSRITDTQALTLLDYKLYMLILKCIIVGIFKTMPIQCKSYFEPELVNMDSWYRLGHLSMELIRSHCLFRALLRSACKKTKSNIPQPTQSQLSEAIDDDILTQIEACVADTIPRLLKHLGK
ncbi:hypothetical protein BdWA1_002075 [Babesia duncani]|uniref:Uncharacterized protein n=1 Tax=Babesia duncani TaxID=323732 RepID=A0AAD9UPC2_9APIC|nr:hypothetical protein BdWA1_003661 [Babesia duncani]KAK2196826.1 hypothetical protein BdWA1_002075 [Babesia duncani]